MSPDRPITAASIVQWSTRPVAARVGQEVVLMNLERSRCYGLGVIGSDIWKRLEAPILISELIDQLLAEYAAERSAIERDVLDALRQYASEGLVVVDPPRLQS